MAHLHWGGFSSCEIAEELQRAPATIRRELRRNRPEEGRHEARSAQRRSVVRRVAASSQLRIKAAVWLQVEVRLIQGWSPGQMAGSGEVAASHERI